MKTYVDKPQNIKRQWFLVDAKDQVLGRLATQVATYLQGKHKPSFTPHIDGGDYVVIINARQIRLTGTKAEQKTYYRHSGYPGGIKETKVSEMSPVKVLGKAVEGMLPKNKLAAGRMKRLKVYPGSDHEHTAQSPTKLEIK